MTNFIQRDKIKRFHLSVLIQAAPQYRFVEAVVHSPWLRECSAAAKQVAKMTTAVANGSWLTAHDLRELRFVIVRRPA